MFEATRQVHSSTVITRNLGEKDVLGVMIVVFIVVPITLELATGRRNRGAKITKSPALQYRAVIIIEGDRLFLGRDIILSHIPQYPWFQN